jgi:hypothetical protein
VSDGTVWWLSALTLANFGTWIGIWGVNSWRSTLEERFAEERQRNGEQATAALTVGIRNAENMVALCKQHAVFLDLLKPKGPK